MRLNHRRQPDLFEGPSNRSSIPSHRRQATVEILRTLLTEAVSSASSMQIDVKGDGSAFRQVDKLGVEVDRNWFTRGCRRDRVPVLGVVQGDGENAVTEAVGVKDLAETRCNDAANAEISQRPDGLLAA